MDALADTRPAATAAARAAANASVIRRLWDEAFNQGNVEILDELVQAEFTNFGRTVDGPESLTQLINAQRAAFPDMQFTIEQTFAVDDWVLTKARWAGTFTGPFPFIGLDGVAPTGRRFDVAHVHGFRLVDGKIAEHWAVRDDLTMHTQLLGSPTT